MKITIKNPAKARPLSANVRRLMTMARESPENAAVQKIYRHFTERDLAYCDMQGNIFMAAVDRGVGMDIFAPLYMTSQLAGVMDHSFSVAGGMEDDDLSNLLQVPMLLKSPDMIVDVVLWLNNIVSQLEKGKSANQAVVEACIKEKAEAPPATIEVEVGSGDLPTDIETLADEYEYAYWLGYIYRYECLMHDESSRMVYGAFSEAFMRETYAQMFTGDAGADVVLVECAEEICKRLDSLLIGKLWK